MEGRLPPISNGYGRLGLNDFAEVYVPVLYRVYLTTLDTSCRILRHRS